MSMFREVVELLHKSRKERSVSLWFRLFAILGMYVIFFGLALILILMLSGVFNEGERESRIWMENELDHLAESVSQDFGKLSYQGTQFANELSMGFSQLAKEYNVELKRLQSYPECLEKMLKAQMQLLLSVLENYDCSGSFIILDATVNPGIAKASESRAGIFLKRTEPNTVTAVGSKIHYLRGPAEIARSTGIELLGQWQMEFDVAKETFYEKTMHMATVNAGMKLSRLYYWSERYLLNGNSESGMLLCFPLIDTDGAVYGVCGVEVSAMLFKLRYSPDNSRYPYIFSVLAPANQQMDTGLPLIAGNSYLTNLSEGPITQITSEEGDLQQFRSQEENRYIGLSRTIKLYSSESPYADSAFQLAVMMPESDWKVAVRNNNLPIYASLILLITASLIAAGWISKRYIRPVIGVFNQIKSEAPVQAQRTNISEIDDLLVFLERQDEERGIMAAELERMRAGNTAMTNKGEKKEIIQPNLTAYQEFVKNIDTLSQAERAVFELYMKGHTAREITELLCLSINTIKTHNKRIYNKLNVTSRKELMVYVQMMSEETKK